MTFNPDLLYLALIFSIAFQISAAVLAFRMIRITGKHWAWMMISGALLLMIFRRITSLMALAASGFNSRIDPFDEYIGLLLSFLMMMGVVRIKPLFLSSNMANEALLLKNFVFDRAITANSIADSKGVIKEANNAFLRIWGYKDRTEVIGHPLGEFIADKDAAGLILEGLNNSGRWEGEYMARRKDGSVFSAYGLATTVTNGMGEIVGYQSSVLDISERKKAEEELRFGVIMSSAQLKLNGMKDSPASEICTFCMEEGVKLTGSEIGYLAFVNGDETVLTMNSWSSSAMKECAIAIKPVEYPLASTGLWGEAVRQRKPVITNDYQADNIHKKGIPTGHVKIIRHMNVPVFDGDKIVLVAGVGNKSSPYEEGDCTSLTILMQGLWRLLEAKRTGEELEKYQRGLEEQISVRSAQLIESEEKFRTMADFTYDWEYWLDPERRVVYTSPSCERITGYTPDYFYGNPGAIDGIIYPDDLAVFQGHAGKFHLGEHDRGDKDIEFRIVSRNGEVKWIGHSCQPILGKNGVYRGRRASNRDITSKKSAEAAIMALNDQLTDKTAGLESANKELESFAYSVSHDLRAPLRTIDGFSAALIEDYSAKLDGSALDYLQRVRAATQRMGQLIEDMLKLSRITRSEIRLQRVDLSDIAKTVAFNLRNTNPGRQVEFVIAPSAEVQGDPQLLRVLMENLLQNAWKFTGKKSYSRIEFGQSEKDGILAYFIRDDGAGFDMRYAEKMFGAFQRLHSTEDFPGTGIGLATVHRVVQIHSGRIWAEGETGRGATFYFTIEKGERRHTS